MTSVDGPMDAAEVPGPEPEWEPAAQFQGGKKNPARQFFMWEQAISSFREIALLRVRFHDAAGRLRLLVEEGLDGQLGPVEAAFLTIGRIDFAISCFKGEPVGVVVWLHRAEKAAPDEALEHVLAALGVDRTVVATSVDAEGRWSTVPQA
jgi:hypothetical protein